MSSTSMRRLKASTFANLGSDLLTLSISNNPNLDFIEPNAWKTLTGLTPWEPYVHTSEELAKFTSGNGKGFYMTEPGSWCQLQNTTEGKQNFTCTCAINELRGSGDDPFPGGAQGQCTCSQV